MTVRTLLVLIACLLLGNGCGATDPNQGQETIEESVSSLEGAPAIHDIELSTGVRLEYLEQGNPAGDPVIFLHG
jgi:hypothetical protein